MTDIAELIETHTKGVETKLEAALDRTTAVERYLNDIEQKFNRRIGGGGTLFGGNSGTWRSDVADAFIQAKGGDLANMSRTDRLGLEVKASITSSTANAAGSAGDLVVPTRDGIFMGPKRRLTIRNLLNTVQVTSGSVQYPRLKSGASNAGMVAEGALKPQSDLQIELKDAPIRTIAHFVKASRQITEDAPQLRDLIDVELRYGLAIQEELQLLYGDGTGQNLLGIVPQATAFNEALRVANDTKIDTIGRAILQVSLTDLAPDGIVMHPADWWDMRLTKDADGKYILGDPMADVSPNLFGLPVVPTQAHAAGTFTVGAMGAQTLYDRWNVRIELGFENDDFTRNLVTLLGEERIGLAVKQPQSVVNGPFTAA